MRRIVSAALLLLFAVSCLGAPAVACTSFCLDTKDGPVFGTNLDFFSTGDGLVLVNKRGVSKQGYMVGPAGEVARWTSKYGSLAFSLVGREFAWGGLNEAGLVVTTMAMQQSKLPDPDGRPPVDSGIWVQYQLDNCATVREVILTDSLVRLADDRFPCHFLVCDASGDCATIEFLDGRLVCHTGDDLPVKVLTNSPYAETFSHLERDTLPDVDPGETVRRFVAAAKDLERYAESDSGSAVDYAMRTLTETVVAGHTRWSIVFDIPNREISFRTAASPSRKHVSMKGFDFSCETPVLMLDVNSPAEGNVHELFEEYDRRVNVRIFLDFCNDWDMEITEEEANEFMDFLEGFPCTL